MELIFWLSIFQFFLKQDNTDFKEDNTDSYIYNIYHNIFTYIIMYTFYTYTFVYILEKEMATPSSILAWRMNPLDRGA